jgi:hypothetical protein
MATAIQLLRSKVARLRPDPGTLSEGMPMVNIAADEPGLFFRATDGSLVKIGPATVSSFAPNNAPAGFGGNTIGEIWMDVSDAEKPILKVWSGSEWLEVSGSATNSTVPPSSPDEGDFWFDLNTNNLNFWDGSAWVSIVVGPAGADTEVQFNDGGEFAGSSGMTYNKTTETLTVSNLNVNALNPLP